MKTKVNIVVLLLFFSSLSYGQDADTMNHRSFKDRVVLFTDVGFHSAPFSLKDNYELGQSKLKYRNNLKVALGVGFAYRWLAFRIGFALPGNILSESRYGNTNYLDLGLKFNIKQTFCNIDFHSYSGYSIKNAYQWNDTLNELTPNDIRPFTRSASVSANVWWFLSKDFNIKAALGRTGHFTGESKTWYLKSSMNFFGVSNDHGTLVPTELLDTSDRVRANTIGAIDLGVIPGYVYGNRINNWQFSVFAGLGGVIQSKFYSKGDLTRSFIGVAPRVDFRLTGGYSKPGYFVLVTTDFDIKSVSIQDLTYNQTFYNIKLVGGFRIQTKRSRRKEKSEAS